MPNWVNSDISFTGKKLALDELFIKLSSILEKEDGLFNHIKPRPEILTLFRIGWANDSDTGEEVRVWKELPNGTDAEGNAITRVKAIPEDEAKEIIAEHGTLSWYDWSMREWGTKWDVSAEECEIRRNPRSVTLFFTTAWSCPTPILEKLAIDFGVRVSVKLSGEVDGEKRISFRPELTD